MNFQPSEETYSLESYTALLGSERNWIANLSNTAAFLHEAMKKHWTGFYLVQGEELILGPFQGPVACTRITYGKGVCGTAWKEQKTIVVPDVHAFEGHIACSPLSNSEIVVPLFHKGEVMGVLDIDSAHFNDFTEEDQRFLESVCEQMVKSSDVL